MGIQPSAIADRKLLWFDLGHLIRFVIIPFACLGFISALCGCQKKVASPAEAPASAHHLPFHVNPQFPGGDSVLIAARRAFPQNTRISLEDFWLSRDPTHDFVVFFGGREIAGEFESMYWRYLVFVKSRDDRDWSNARVFDLPDNHPGAWSGKLPSLEKAAIEIVAPQVQQ